MRLFISGYHKFVAQCWDDGLRGGVNYLFDSLFIEIVQQNVKIKLVLFTDKTHMFLMHYLIQLILLIKRPNSVLS